MKPPHRGTRKGVLWAIIILSSFIFFMFLVLFSYRAEGLGPVTELFMQHHFFFMLMLGALGVAVGATVFYFMSQKVDEERTVAKVNAEIVLRFLSREERQIITRLIAENGKATQAELTRMEGMNKVKVHRVLQKLEQKEIITLENYGKTNTVRLKPEILDALS